MKIKKYSVITGRTIAEVIIRCNEAIKDGWQPFHGPIVVHTGDVIPKESLLQALVQYED